MQLAYPEKYYEKVKERFPDLTYREIDTIVKFGLRSLFINCGYGGDILLKAPYFTMYIGRFFSDAKLFWKYRVLKESIKLRIKYKRAKTEWDGYYYFGLSDEEYQEYLSENFKPRKTNQGLHRTKFRFKKIKCYKLLEECQLYPIYKHIFRLKYSEDVGFSFWKENYATYNAQYILRKNNNNWETIEIKDKKSKYINRNNIKKK